MKFILKYLFFFLSITAFSQNGIVNGKVIIYEENLPAPGLTLEVIKEGKTIWKTFTDIEGNYTLNLPVGIYELKMSFIGFRDKIIKEFVIENEPKKIDIIFPDPCVESKKVCPKNHKDNLIPIIYGFPSKKMMRKAKNGKIYLGGCNPSYCEKWYCKIHDEKI